MTWTRSLLKYPGGKYSLLESIETALPRSNIDVYIEPFVGGASVALNIGRRYPQMILNDANGDVITFWEQIAKNPAEVIKEVERYVNLNNSIDSDQVYSNCRNEFNSSKSKPHTKAAQFYYLNKQGFNGLIRYNLKGEFNVPYGKYKTLPSVNIEHFQEVSQILNSNVSLYSLDAGRFIEKVIMRTENKDKKLFFYIDPPYIPISKTSNFTCYWKPFGIKEHEKLRKTLDKLTSLGALWMISNSKTEETENIFHGYNFTEVSAPRSISCKGNGRGSIIEYIITNYKP